MTREPEKNEREGPTRTDLERQILDDDRRRSGEFLRDYLARNRVECDAPMTP